MIISGLDRSSISEGLTKLAITVKRNFMTQVVVTCRHDDYLTNEVFISVRGDHWEIKLSIIKKIIYSAIQDVFSHDVFTAIYQENLGL